LQEFCMVSRYPSSDFYANSKAKLSLQWRGGRGCKRLDVSTVTLVFVALPLTVLMMWYLVASFYFVFRDDMLAKLLSNQAETQYAYEDRIASLRAHLDRVATKQLVSQDSFEDRVNELIARQSQLETRQAIVSALISDAQRQVPRGSVASPKQTQQSPVTTGTLPVIKRGFTPPSTVPMPVPSGSGGPLVQMPVPQQNTPITFPKSKKSSANGADVSGLRLGGDNTPNQAGFVTGVGFQWANQVDAGLTRIEQNQVASLAQLERSTETKITQMRGVLAEIGLNAKRFALNKSTEEPHVGGPLEALSKNANDAFDRAVIRLVSSLKEAGRASTVLQSIPLARPLAGDQAITSNFGARSDPFLHTVAMHTGMDFKSPYGSPVYSASAGRVIGAGHQGGYGNMVELDHGYGITTRYAHLSSISVDVGDSVAKGETVGLVGSTGRSTGPHLHYETRIDGEATDPMRFLQAASRLGVK
jgi:murein DD-endopeptidase MepM/ murein hydrolase activator NlpD